MSENDDIERFKAAFRANTLTPELKTAFFDALHTMDHGEQDRLVADMVGLSVEQMDDESLVHPPEVSDRLARMEELAVEFMESAISGCLKTMKEINRELAETSERLEQDRQAHQKRFTAIIAEMSSPYKKRTLH